MAYRSPTAHSSATDRKSVVVLGLDETYPELGEYEFKVALDPDRFQNSHHCDVHMIDSDGNPIKCVVRRWGRKMNCTFTIDPNVADGVSTILVSLKEDELASVITVRYSCWIIKP
jgi:hypothetical protein